jgi:hypothetical protein
MLLVVATWPGKRPARGPHRRLPNVGIPAAAATAAAEQRATPTRCYMAQGNDMIAPGRGCIGGNIVV